MYQTTGDIFSVVFFLGFPAAPGPLEHLGHLPILVLFMRPWSPGVHGLLFFTSQSFMLALPGFFLASSLPSGLYISSAVILTANDYGLVTPKPAKYC